MNGEHKSGQGMGFIRLPAVLSIIPVSRARWYAGIQSGDFPRPVKLSERVSAWKRSDIEALCARLAGEDAR